MWNKTNTPRKAGEHVYSQEFGDEPGESYMEYDGADGDLKFRDKNTDVVTLTELLGLKETDKHRREFGDEPGKPTSSTGRRKGGCTSRINAPDS